MNGKGFTLYGTYIEPGFEACLECEILTGCREHSPYCRRKQIAGERKATIPDGWVSVAQIAIMRWVDQGTVRRWIRTFGHAVGARRFQYNSCGRSGWIIPEENVEKLAQMVQDATGTNQ